jgi:hypothetical protein
MLFLEIHIEINPVSAKAFSGIFILRLFKSFYAIYFLAGFFPLTLAGPEKYGLLPI